MGALSKEYFSYWLFLFAFFQSRNLALQVEQEIQRRTLMQADFKTQTVELTKMKTKEKHFIGVSKYSLQNPESSTVAKVNNDI